jgi:hypothetical protein
LDTLTLKKENPISGRLKQLFFVVFVLLLALSMGYGYLRFAEDARTTAVLPAAVLWLALLWLIDHFARRLTEKSWLSRHFTAVALAAAGVFFAVVLALANLCRYTPQCDLDAIFNGALNWLNGSLTSGQFNTTIDPVAYFYYFPNNLGGMAVLAGAFRVFGMQDAFLSACIFNSLLLTVLFLSVVFSLKELAGVRGGVDGLALVCCNLPLWFAGAFFYTDSLSLAFPTAAFYCLLRAKRAQKVPARCGWVLGAAAIFAAGGFAKITVLILAIAAGIWLLLQKDWKKALLLGVATALLTAGAQGALQAALYPSQLDPATAEIMNTPTLHWVMMGLKDDGYYNPQDYTFTRSFTSTQERDAALRQEIANRMQGFGLTHLIRHNLRKIGHDISSGTLQLSDFYDDGPMQPEWMQNLLLTGRSPANSGYEALCGGIHLCMLLLMLYGAAKQIRGCKIDFAGCLWLGYFGLMVFLSMWETDPRYTVNYTGVLMICAALGLLALPQKKAAPKKAQPEQAGAAAA